MWVEKEYVEAVRAGADWSVVLGKLGVEGRAIREEYRSRCPFHGDTRPSFYFRVRRGVFYCHGCGERGDGFQLVMRLRGVGFPEAVEWVATQCGVERARSPEGLLRELAEYYHWWLWRSTAAQEYLEARGITDRRLWGTYGLGYAPGGQRAQDFLSARGYSVEQLASAGLVNRRGLDVFFRRLLFPLCSGTEVVNLYGRNLGSKFPHMYLPGPREVLLGFPDTRARARGILVEGLFDFLTLRQWGYDEALTGLSANLSHPQIQRLRQGAWQELLVAFDGDDSGAGRQAAHALVEKLQGVDFPIHLVELPKGRDVNDCLVRDHFTRADFDALLRRTLSC